MHTNVTFRAWLREEGYSPRTVETYLSFVRRANTAIGSLYRATPDTLRAWWATLPPSASSRNGARKALVAYYRSRGRADGGPARALPTIPPPDALPRPVAADLYERFITAAADLGGRYELLGGLLAYTGCRISEARVARRSDFEFGERPTWRIHGKGARRRGPKQRVVALHPALLTVLRTWPEPDWLFPSPHRHAPVHRTTITNWLRAIAGQADLDITAHRVRHTVATLGLERSLDIRAVQELLGHASLATTQKYTYVNGDRVRSLVAHLGPAA